MIAPICFTKNWLDTVKQVHPNWQINPPLLEKMLYALSLVELLAQYNLDFVFKGGTSLVVLLDEPKRFSIDIDIITMESHDTIRHVLDQICQQGSFLHWNLEEHRSFQMGVPKAHYELYFNSIYNQNTYILLDVLFEKSLYPNIALLTIQKNWFETQLPMIPIQIPTLEAITGDKMTAFAPKTVGILYSFLQPKQIDKSTEIIKQLFDIGQLFNEIQDMKQVADSFYNIVAQELTYRTNMQAQSVADVFADILETCWQIAKFDEKDTSLEMTEIRKGINHFKNWSLIPFRKEQAQEAAGKVAYLVLKMQQQDWSKPLIFNNLSNKAAYLIPNTSEYNFLNKKLKNIPNGALFYWYQVVQLLTI
jgi:predicted nucleotidyltransferase component of viral defense system